MIDEDDIMGLDGHSLGLGRAGLTLVVEKETDNISRRAFPLVVFLPAHCYSLDSGDSPRGWKDAISVSNMRWCFPNKPSLGNRAL